MQKPPVKKVLTEIDAKIMKKIDVYLDQKGMYRRRFFEDLLRKFIEENDL